MAENGAESPKPDGTGATVGGYEIIRKIGQGAMGAVFLARQVSINRNVALKLMPPKLAKDSGYVERFLREARAAARLSHPNIVQAYDVGFANGYYYFAMELVDGRSLREELEAEGALAEPQALQIALDIARALQHAHQSNIIHRDVKPENILLTKDGTAKLADLGIAKDVSSDELSLTQSGEAIGSPFTISPEQIRNKGDVDGRTDVYALGATLFQALTGVPPYRGGSAAETMAMHLTSPVPDPRPVKPGISEGAALVVRRAMAKDRTDRYPNAGAMAAEIQRILAKKEAIAVAAAGVAKQRLERTALKRPARRARPKKSAGIYIVVTAVVLAAGLIAAITLLPNKGETRRAAAPPTAEPAATVPAGSETGKASEADAAWIGLENDVRKLCEDGDYDAALALIRKVTPGEGDSLKDRRAALENRVENEATALIQERLDAARRAAAAGNIKGAKSELDEVARIKYAPAAGEIERTVRNVAEHAATTPGSAAASRPGGAASGGPKEPDPALLAKNDDLMKGFLAKTVDKRTDDLKDLENRYKAPFESAKAAVDRDKAHVQDFLNEMAQRQRAYESRSAGRQFIGSWATSAEKARMDQQLAGLKRTLDADWQKYNNITMTIVNEKNRIMKDAENRALRIRKVQAQNVQTMKSGETLTGEQMEKNYQDAFGG